MLLFASFSEGARLFSFINFFFFNDTATTEIYTLHIVGSVRCVQETVSTQSTWEEEEQEKEEEKKNSKMEKVKIYDQAVKRGQVDNSAQYFLLHYYILSEMKNQNKEDKTKQAQLKQLGQRIGRVLMERLSVDKLVKLKKTDKDKSNKYVEHIRYICTDFWIYVFGKQLTTTLQQVSGIFYLKDKEFKLFEKISGPNFDTFVLLWESFLEGIIEGGLEGLNIESQVECTKEKAANEFNYIIKVINYEQRSNSVSVDNSQSQ
eukprot:TRINITY_DN10955_c0_g1_i2.p2 TRINITY_DN10955_c0_g1~~TRINITY_DN10955_c0_g1_i2.p2  ORF type:complete len:261 (-),score=76.06 TRINITY_DN10955_c0_g1_i2:212-994(-)